MSVIALPSSFRPETFSMRLSTVQRAFGGPFGGSEQVIDLMQDRWMLSLSIPRRDQESQVRIEAFINAMRGMTNTVNLHHFGRPVPRGTMRGTPISWGMPRGSATQNITTTAGATLLAGDMIGVGGLLLQASNDCVANGMGLLVVPLVNRLRKTVDEGLPVTWGRPSVPFRLTSTPSVQYVPGYAEGLSLDFVEDVS